ncbi:Amino acid transporter [Mycena indigotica]|uniref:Amino acid transporter n=1 Tax=Mycena indigotica TaxID=2126181 RepID=A0A8H6W478_9AGAR|nr:Amino acid transporter [Mycena indigotica]KAF7298689.1 Amino acid transporter [Mycena indigotica]
MPSLFSRFGSGTRTGGDEATETARNSTDKAPLEGSDEKVNQDVKGDESIEVASVSGGAELSFEEDVQGGMGRHLGVFSCTMLVIGKIIGTGIFSTPSSILSSVGSVGASLLLWVLGFALALSGLLIWLELGTMMPRSGGDKVYLEAMYPRPKYLATIVFTMNAILLGFTASGCIVFAQNILIAAGQEHTRWVVRGIALGVIVAVTLLHGLLPKVGILVMNILSVFKVAILSVIVVAGWVVLSGKTHIEDPHVNFRNAFAGSSNSSNDYATAMFKVLFSYAGWSNVNNVMNDVKNPVRTLKIAAPLGLGICATLYLFANIAYFAVATKQEIIDANVTVAALFFKKVFGEKAQRALSVFVALSALGFWASNWPTGKSPLPGLIIHLIPSIIVIIGPPPAVAYPFILDIEGYPSQIINLFIVIGLFWLRYRYPTAKRPFKVWLSIVVFYMASAVFLLVAPFLKPANGVGDTPPLPYYLYCLVGIAIMATGFIYWGVWRILLPKVFGYRLQPRKVQLEDGTFVTLFSREKVE